MLVVFIYALRDITQCSSGLMSCLSGRWESTDRTVVIRTWIFSRLTINSESNTRSDESWSSNGSTLMSKIVNNMYTPTSHSVSTGDSHARINSGISSGHASDVSTEKMAATTRAAEWRTRWLGDTKYQKLWEVPSIPQNDALLFSRDQMG